MRIPAPALDLPLKTGYTIPLFRTIYPYLRGRKQTMSEEAKKETQKKPSSMWQRIVTGACVIAVLALVLCLGGLVLRSGCFSGHCAGHP